MLDVKAGDRMCHIDFAGKRALVRAATKLASLAGIEQRLWLAARWRFAENLEGLTIVGGVVDDNGPTVAAEKKFERGPPALCFRLHLDEPAELLGTAAEFLTHGLEEWKSAG